MINRAARIALGDIRSNCIPFKDGLLTQEKVCVMAGIDYDTPWTRDTAINTVNAVAVLEPETAGNTMMSVLEEHDGIVRVGGQYWDKIIWVIAADRFCDITADASFREFAVTVSDNTFRQLEAEEFDDEFGLFRGPAVYGDGVAAYPDRYAKPGRLYSGILEWPDHNPDERIGKGYGIPIKALSTNITYYEAYLAAAGMADKAGIMADKADTWRTRAASLKENINKYFWNTGTGRYDYFFDHAGKCDYAEALGLSFAILSDIADEKKTASIIENTYVSAEGIPVVWPAFPRYAGEETLPDGRSRRTYGRHCGTIWPHAEGFWALAMKKAGYGKGFDLELMKMAERATRDMHFAEIYHPDTGEIYGGLQEQHGSMKLWDSCSKQTWSATAFLAMILYGIAGISYSDGAITSAPYLPAGMNEAVITGLPTRDGSATISVKRESGKKVTADISFMV